MLSLAALRDVRRAFPKDTLGVLARPSVAPLYGAAPFVDRVLVARDVWDEIGALRAGGFDRAIIFPNSIGTAFAAFAAGIADRAGYATQGRGFLLTRSARVPREVRGRTQVDYYRAMLAGIGIDTATAADASLACPDAWRADGRALLGNAGARWVGLAPGAAKGTAKQWPAERFAAAGDRLGSETGSTVVLLGSDADRPAAQDVAKRMSMAPLDLSGRTSLRELVGVIANLDGLVSNDSGAMHVGAALGVPTVGVFGPTNPDETRPVGARATFVRGVAECSPCRHVTCPIDHRCMTSVSPQTVAEALLRATSDGRPS